MVKCKQETVGPGKAGMRGGGKTERVGLRPALRRLLADGEWHSFDDLYEQVSPLIAPETAERRYHGLRRGERSPEEMVEFGRREIVRGALYLMRVPRRGARGVALSEQSFRLPPKEV